MSYEFNEQENQKIQRFAFGITFFSLSWIALGIIATISAIIPEFQFDQIFTALIIMGVGLLLLYPVRNFRAVVKTEGNDITEIMDGFSKLNTGFTIIIFIAILLPVVLLVSGFL